MDARGETPLVWIEAEGLAAEFLSEPFPPRSHRGTLGPLVRSMKENGCICPIIARPVGEKLQVVCGYRRLIAAQAAKLRAVPVLVRELSDEECRRLFNEENFHRLPHSEDARVRSWREPALDEEAGGGEAHPITEADLTEILAGEAGESPPQMPPMREDQAATLRRIIEKQRKASITDGPIPYSADPGEEDWNWSTVEQEARPAAETQILPVILGGILGKDRPAFAGGPAPDPAPAAGVSPEGLKDVPDLGMLSLARRTASCFEDIRLSRSVPVEDLEAIAAELIGMAPLRRGKDLRIFAAGGSQFPISSHCLVVAGLGIHLAEALEWTPGQVKKFALACLLHDIGMLFIPPQILGANRALERSERLEVERHCELGAELIQGSHAWGAQVCLVAQDHHERWNGMGYPRRKKGKDVDLPSRMVAFLDCFGALISRRPHRPPLLYSQALKTMSALTEIGLHDPAILVHFRNVFTEMPVGSCLRLKDGRVGRVVGRDLRDHRRYRLRIIDPSPVRRPEPPVWIDPECIASEIQPSYDLVPVLPSEPGPARRVEIAGARSTAP